MFCIIHSSCQVWIVCIRLTLDIMKGKEGGILTLYIEQVMAFEGRKGKDRKTVQLMFGMWKVKRRCRHF